MIAAPSFDFREVPSGCEHVLFASYGNDSVALIQWAAERKLRNVFTLYNQTGWATSDWESRVLEREAWVASLGFTPARTFSIGMEALVMEKKAWPRQGMQFCTERLKLEPTKAWLAEHDPDGEATCLVGVRREESEERRLFPEWTEESDVHGGRSLWAPLANTTEGERDALVRRAGIVPLPHRSRECSPCVNSNKADIRATPPLDIDKTERVETNLGTSGNGKPRVMFRPAKHMGAIGIREIYAWAHSGRGEYEPPAKSGCDGGMCGR